MLNKKELIYFGSILIWQCSNFPYDEDYAIEKAKNFYNKVFKDNDNE